MKGPKKIKRRAAVWVMVLAVATSLLLPGIARALTVNYTYDAMNQLVLAQYIQNGCVLATYQFSYDAAGNCQGVIVSPQTCP